MKSQLLIQAEMWLLLVLVLAAVEVVVVKGYAPIARHGCKDHCGSVSIPFPFGMGKGCFSDQWFEIECKASPNPDGSVSTKPLLSKLGNYEVMEVIVDEEVYIYPAIIVGIPPLNVCVAEAPEQQHNTSMDLRGSPFKFLSGRNVFAVAGCSGNAILRNQRGRVVAGCGTVCQSNNTAIAIPNNSCYGVGCCQTSVFSESGTFSFYRIDAYLQDSSSGGGSQDCIVATLIKSDSANQYAAKLSSLDPPRSSAAAPVVLSWSLTSRVQSDTDSHASCSYENGGVVCVCKLSYYGNPYVSNGCQVREDCKHCPESCIQKWYDRSSYYCKRTLNLAAILGLSISFGVVLLVIGIYGLYRFVKRRREIRRRAKCFKRNGGLLLHQQLSSNEGIVEGTKIFTIVELDKATDHFNENRILGQGGQGTVYKGMLVDGRIVAVKKAKLLDENQLEQFINEVVILSQVNHRNVVKMLGCCLETEVPLLVYEFVPNGTLFQHIHDPDEDFVISWEKRLKIVLDSAGAIAYLHSSASVPIYHRDIKSSNILLDERHRAKVSDFGSSKTIAIDQTHLTTLVQGTMGYLDPEYFQSYQFTDKSDVYSFGVVLLELLTSKKPIYRDASTMEQKNLVTEFSSLMEDSGRCSMLDPEIVREAKEEELMAVVELAKRCINWSGKLRPTMKEVAMTLEMVIKSPDQVSTLFQEQEALGAIAAGASPAEFMSNPLPISPLYIDVKPHLHDTI